MSQYLDDDARAQLTTLFKEVSEDLFRRAFVLTQGRHQDAKDLVQETFHAAAKAWMGDLGRRDRQSQHLWLFRVLHNKWVDTVRKSISHPTSSSELIGDTPGPGDIDNAVLNSLAVAKCWEVIGRMPRERHRVAVLAWAAGWSTAEIADLLGITTSTVRVQLKKARDQLLELAGPAIPFLPAAGQPQTGATEDEEQP